MATLPILHIYADSSGSLDLKNHHGLVMHCSRAAVRTGAALHVSFFNHEISHIHDVELVAPRDGS